MLIAIGNSGDGTLTREAERLLSESSPMVRGAAVWALSRLLDDTRFSLLAREQKPRENDASVIAEWDLATD